MAAVVLTIVLIVVAWLLYKAIEDARRQKAGGSPSAAPSSPAPTPRARPKPKARPRPRRSSPAEIDREGLEEHVHKLRLAIDDDLITMDEGVASVVRFTDGALGDDAARKLLRDAG